LAFATGRLPLGSAVSEKSRMDWYFSSALAGDFFGAALRTFLTGFLVAAMSSSPLRKHSSGKAFPFRVSKEKRHGSAQEDQGREQSQRWAGSAQRGHHKPANSNEPHLSSRPSWQGSLRLSLVSCPVALYGATSRTADISFHLLNPETNNRIRMIPTDPDTGPVERSDLVKGYEISKKPLRGPQQ
jgi:hypothetical protein